MWLLNHWEYKIRGWVVMPIKPKALNELYLSKCRCLNSSHLTYLTIDVALIVGIYNGMNNSSLKVRNVSNHQRNNM